MYQLKIAEDRCSIFGVAVELRYEFKWAFLQGDAVFHGPQRVYVYAEKCSKHFHTAEQRPSPSWNSMLKSRISTSVCDPQPKTEDTTENRLVASPQAGASMCDTRIMLVRCAAKIDPAYAGALSYGDTTMRSVLIIDDDIDFCEMLRDYLHLHEICLNARHNGIEGLAELFANPYDMLLLDLMLPDIDGYEVLRRLKESSSVSVLLLSTLGGEDDRILGLDEGADDYLPKPFNPRELVSRITAVWRRSDRGLARPCAVAPDGPGLEVNQAAHDAYYQGNRLHLTNIEFSLLCIFLESPGTVLEREDLTTRVFQRPFSPLDRSLDMHISRLRRKLAAFDEYTDSIKTIRSSGYLYSPRLAKA